MMTALNELTDNCQTYWKLHAKARKAEGVPAPETLEQINTCWESLTQYEKDHITWVNSLYTNSINIQEIKRQIKVLARYLADKPLKDDDVESCKPAKRNGRAVHWWSKEKRYTQLCALRATMRGKLHFSSSSNLQQLKGCYQIPCEIMADSAYSKNCPTGEYKPIDLAIQREWVESVAEEFYA